jgi:hypothetical protein
MFLIRKRKYLFILLIGLICFQLLYLFSLSSIKFHSTKNIYYEESNPLKDILKKPLKVSNWIGDGISISTASNHQEDAEIISDGFGGAIIVWEDYRMGPTGGVYAQRINSSGDRYWTNNGVVIIDDFLGQVSPHLATDGNGGAFITWSGWSGIDVDIQAQYINSSGDLQWGGELNISSATGNQDTPLIIPDGVGGAIIVWVDNRGSDRDLYAQRINASGDLYWSIDGVEISTAINDQRNPQISTDGDGGVFIVWADYRDNPSSPVIYAQRINKTGDAVWTGNGTVIANNQTGHIDPVITYDGVGNAIIAWEDGREIANRNVYAQKINKSGDIYWGGNGTAVCTAVDIQGQASISSDGADGAIIAWEDRRDYGISGIDVYAQRINSSGDGQWGVNGKAISIRSFDDDQVHVISDGNGGAVIGWDYGVPQVQIINSTGDLQLATNGEPVITQSLPNQINFMSMCEGPSSNLGTAFIVWDDERDGASNRNIRAQFAKMPSTPTLNPIFPAVDYDGSINFNWTQMDYTIEYYVFRNTSFISSLGSLTPIATTTQNSYTDTPPGSGTYYYVIVAKGAIGNSSISNCENVQVVLPNLTLSEGQVDPTSGLIGITLFNFTVNYTQSNNVAPTSINITLDGVDYNMTKVNLGDSDYTDGCLYYYNSTLSTLGTHQFNFTASDGTTVEFLGNFSNPVVNSLPELSNGQVDPISGIVDITLFNFSVNYTHASNIAPSWINITLDGLNYTMAKVNTGDTDYTDGCLYYYNSTLNTLGTHEFNFSASDGSYIKFDGTFNNPVVNPQVNPPGPLNLTHNASKPDDDGNFYLMWNISTGAVNYSIYVSNKTITVFNATVIEKASGLNNYSYYFSGLSNGTYFYVVVAFNNNGNSTSNCINITIAIPPDGPGNGGEPEFNLLEFLLSPLGLGIIGAIGIAIGLFIVLQKKKRSRDKEITRIQEITNE